MPKVRKERKKFVQHVQSFTYSKMNLPQLPLLLATIFLFYSSYMLHFFRFLFRFFLFFLAWACRENEFSNYSEATSTMTMTTGGSLLGLPKKSDDNDEYLLAQRAWSVCQNLVYLLNQSSACGSTRTTRVVIVDRPHSSLLHHQHHAKLF